jgi:negative regulator of sigma E activity
VSDEKDLAAFERRTKRLFDDSVAGLDAATRSRLTQARHRALAELPAKGARAWRFPLVPVGVAAATVLVAWFTVLNVPSSPDSAVPATAALADLEILLGEEDLELLDEELEFYGWLEEQPEFADAGDSVG